MNNNGVNGVSRRGFLMGSLGSSLVITAAGTTGLVLRTSPSYAADTFVSDVTGSYSFEDAATGCVVDVSVANGVRRIRSNGIPNHSTGQFPNSSNPNAISAQDYDYSFPSSPSQGKSAETYTIPQPFGIAVNGVLFDPLAAEWYNSDRNSGWSYNALGSGIDLGLDENDAHVQPTGAYHYHGIPDGLVDTISRKGHSPLIGWAGDGFPIYLDRGYKKPRNRKSGLTRLTSSYQLKSGTRPSGPGGRYNGDYNEDYEYIEGSGDLDAANGRFQKTPEFPKGTYAYILTKDYPVIPRAFIGSIADSFVKSGGGAAGNGPTNGQPGAPSGGQPGPGGQRPQGAPGRPRPPRA